LVLIGVTVVFLATSPMSFILISLSFVIIIPIWNYITEVIATNICADKGVYEEYFRIKGEIKRVTSEIRKIDEGKK